MALIYLSNHKLAGSQCATRRERTTLFLSSVREGKPTESVNVTRVCVACSTGNTIYTMQIKHARALHTSGPGPALRRIIINVFVIIPCCALSSIASRTRRSETTVGISRINRFRHRESFSL